MRIILADDHQLVCDGLKKILDVVPEYEVIAQVGDTHTLMETIEGIYADLVFLDYHMPGGGAIPALQAIKQRFPHIKIIFLTGSGSGALLKQLLHTEADGILLKGITSEDLLDAVQRVMSGEKVISPSIEDRAQADELALTPREFHVLDLIVSGLANGQIATRLGVATKTVENHRFNLMHKLQVRNVAELVHLAHTHGLVSSQQIVA
jgi:DNA-binding NarL/FixJ family response regulator